MDVATYLERIGYHGPCPPTAETLRALHRAHVLTVPFENLDIHLGHPIVLNEACFYDKIVRRGRGGFCYELNGLFAALLRTLGFDVRLISARVMTQGRLGPEFDHMALSVRLGGRWLVDVGFDAAFWGPLRLDTFGEQHRGGGSYCLASMRGHRVLWKRLSGGTRWQPQYCFTLKPRRLSDFQAMCCYHQSSPESSFTRQSFCSRATTSGRVTLSGRRLIVTTHDRRCETEIAGETEYVTALRDHFGIELSERSWELWHS